MKRLSIIDKIKLLSLLDSTTNQIEDGIKMKNSTKIVAAVFSLITGALMNPTIQSGAMQFVSHNPVLSIVVTGIASVCALLHQPQITSGS